MDVDNLVDSASSDNISYIDNSNLIKHIEWLERSVLINLDHRSKYAKEPQKYFPSIIDHLNLFRFMESEVQLNEELTRFESVAAEPELLPLLSTKWFETFLPLLQHPNTDISAKVTSLIAEMIEMDEAITPKAYDGLLEYCQKLLSNDLLSLLLENVKRLDESESDEADTVFKTMEILENLLDVNLEMLNKEGSWKDWSIWISDRLFQSTGSLQNKYYTAELCAILLRSVESFKVSFLQNINGIDRTLAALAPYIGVDPSDSDEIEHFENIIDILCDSVLDPKGLNIFIDCQGIEFVFIALNNTNMLRIRAVKLLAFTLDGTAEDVELRKQAIIKLDLAVLYSIFERADATVLKKRYPKYYSMVKELEYVCSIFSWIIKTDRDDAFISDKRSTMIQQLSDLSQTYSNTELMLYIEELLELLKQ